jgi:hypothetical protein
MSTAVVAAASCQRCNNGENGLRGSINTVAGNAWKAILVANARANAPKQKGQSKRRLLFNESVVAY